jgi:nucleoid DNA-binding protein
MPNITKRELAIKITEQLGSEGHTISQQDVLEVIQRLIVVVADSLAEGDQVVMRNFGTFQVRETKAKIGRNPKQPNKTVKIPARATVKFKAGLKLKEQVAASLAVVRKKKA